MITALIITAYIWIGVGAASCVHDGESMFRAAEPSRFGTIVMGVLWPIYALAALGHWMVRA